MSENWKGKYCKKYNPLARQGTKDNECKMFWDCIVLLEWAAKNRECEASITIIAEQTGIPRMTLHWILQDYFERKERSILAKGGRTGGYDFIVYREWNKTNKYKRKKKIIDAVKIMDPMFHDRDY